MDFLLSVESVMIEAVVHSLLSFLAVPEIGLLAVFLVSFFAATLLPMGSEPTVFAVLKAHPDLLLPVVALATLGNTLGGMVDYGIGYAAKQAFARERDSFWRQWLYRYGARTMLLAWLPVIGDPICTVGGYLKLPFWPSAAYMAVGKGLRYLALSWLLLRVPDGFWHRLAGYLG